MNGYKSVIPRLAIGLTAAAMTAITIGSLVVLPAKFDHVRVDLSALAVMNPVANARNEISVRTVGIVPPAATRREEPVDTAVITHEARALPAKRHKSSSHT